VSRYNPVKGLGSWLTPDLYRIGGALGYKSTGRSRIYDSKTAINTINLPLCLYAPPVNLDTGRPRSWIELYRCWDRLLYRLLYRLFWVYGYNTDSIDVFVLYRLFLSIVSTFAAATDYVLLCLYAGLSILSP